MGLLKKIINKVVQILLILIISTVVPFIFQMLKMPGNVFLPIFTTILITSYFLSLYELVFLSLIIPVTNHIFTGMPITDPYPVLQMMTAELIVLSICIKSIKSLPVFWHLLSAVFMARFFSLVLVLFVTGITFSFWFDNIAHSVPGIFLNVFIASFLISKCNTSDK
ncbi:MAG: hypothetical protein GY730_09870 [bacterium]|nr:hypothetical protein [bacterium]